MSAPELLMFQHHVQFGFRQGDVPSFAFGLIELEHQLLNNV